MGKIIIVIVSFWSGFWGGSADFHGWVTRKEYHNDNQYESAFVAWTESDENKVYEYTRMYMGNDLA